MRNLHLFRVVLCALTLAGPAFSQSSAPSGSTPAPKDGRYDPKKKDLTGAVLTPLEDLNLANAEIPPQLLKLAEAPYGALPGDGGCEALLSEVEIVNGYLGPDPALPPKPVAVPVEKPNATQQASDFSGKVSEKAGDASIDAVKSAAGSVIPFRGWVRKLTGAEARAKKVDRVILGGMLRRSYLTGVAMQKGCSIAR